jgi:plasmid stability protein
MGTLTLKNVPDALIDRIKRQAERHRRSLNREAINILEHGAGSGAPMSVEMRLERIRAMRKRYNLPPLTEEFLDEAKSEGRS